jgi:hypothetical protein
MTVQHTQSLPNPLTTGNHSSSPSISVAGANPISAYIVHPSMPVTGGYPSHHSVPSMGGHPPNVLVTGGNPAHSVPSMGGYNPNVLVTGANPAHSLPSYSGTATGGHNPGTPHAVHHSHSVPGRINDAYMHTNPASPQIPNNTQSLSPINTLQKVPSQKSAPALPPKPSPDSLVVTNNSVAKKSINDFIITLPGDKYEPAYRRFKFFFFDHKNQLYDLKTNHKLNKAMEKRTFIAIIALNGKKYTFDIQAKKRKK